MPKFDASKFAPVEYDFTGFQDADGQPINDKGTVPEPSRAAVAQMMTNVQNAFKELGIERDNTDTPEGIVQAMSEVEDDDEDTFQKMTDALAEAIAELCNGRPSRESVLRLPYRAFMGFFGYLMEEVMSPEVSAPDTKRSQRTLKSV
jgi:enamine deaminase RidA (YjgF/YER057c/UK114 family)